MSASATAILSNTLEVELEEVIMSAKKIGASSAADRLVRLKDLITSGTPAQREALATTDLHQLIDVDELIDGLKVRFATPAWFGVLQWVRNTLILVPLVLTWYGIYGAIVAYQHDLDAKPAQKDIPFLYLWQKGFDGYLPPNVPTLSMLVLFVTISIMFLLILTLIISLQTNVYNKFKERSVDKFRADLTDVLAQVKLSVATNPFNMQQPTNFVSYFDQVSQQLLGAMQQERKALDQIVAQQQQNPKQQAELNQAIDHLIIEMQRAMQTLQQTAQTFQVQQTMAAQSSHELSTATQEIKAVVQIFAAEVSRMGVEIRQMNESQRPTENMEALIRVYNQSVTTLLEASDSFSKQTEGLASSIAQLLQGIKPLTENQQRSSNKSE